LALVDDPVGSGLVASLARPGGNVTGLSMQSTDLDGKRLALLREVVPTRLAIMANVDYPAAVLEMGQVQTAAGTPGLDVAKLERDRERINVESAVGTRWPQAFLDSWRLDGGRLPIFIQRAARGEAGLTAVVLENAGREQRV
jgi:hypothetical protein